MTKKISIIGGDLRIIRLAEILDKEDYIIYTYGLEKYNFKNNNIFKIKDINQICNNCESIIGGIPFSSDGIYINAKFSNNQIEIDDLFNAISNKTLIAGAISEKIIEKASKRNIEIIDLLKFEEFTILNVIPTVEGAIQISMEETEYTINGSNCLILGFGRIGKLLALVLKSLRANVFCMARKETDITWINAYGYNEVRIEDLEDNLNKEYDIIFNTIPSEILNKKRLEIIKNYNPLIIELASYPGGIDFETANKLGMNIIKAQGLPGKVAPLTTAINIKKILERKGALKW